MAAGQFDNVALVTEGDHPLAAITCRWARLTSKHD